MTLTRGKSVFLLLFGVWSWFIWVTLVINVAQDPRAFTAGSATLQGDLIYYRRLPGSVNRPCSTNCALFGSPPNRPSGHLRLES